MNSSLQEKCEKCLNCKNPFCRQGCPLSNDIPAFLSYVKRGDLARAVETVGHPFGEVCGYVCPHKLQCGGSCVLSKKGRGVEISEVEKETFARRPFSLERVGDALADVKIAVVGGGVSGITLAALAYRLGAEVTVFEKDKQLSTIKSIPSFRLPKETIERVEASLEGKIKFVSQFVTADDISRLSVNYDFVYIATGLSCAYGLRIDGENLAKSYRECLDGKVSGKVVVVGGGNTAIDCARLSKRNGCEVTVAYRRTKQDMPAFPREIEEAESDGVNFMFNVAPVSLQKNGGDLVLTVAKTVTEGRDKLTVTSQTSQIICDYVVSAVGGCFDKSLVKKCDADEKGWLYDNIYIGGDAKGGSLVVHAVLHAKQTLDAILERVR